LCKSPLYIINNIEMADEKKDDDLIAFINELYDITKIAKDEFKTWVDAYSYKGFNRSKVLKDLRVKVNDVKVVQQIILICGLLGPQRASQMKLLNGKVIGSYGIPASGMKGSEGVSCQRITAATADLCAYFLKIAGVPKRMQVECPAWLQFPSAGSITLPDTLRQQHIEFAERFSTVIGGAFNAQIYNQMMVNTYLEPKLGLFSDYIEPPQQQQQAFSTLSPISYINPSVQPPVPVRINAPGSGSKSTPSVPRR
jgi:hypothetical protein